MTPDGKLRAAAIARCWEEAAEIAGALGMYVQSVSWTTVRIGYGPRPGIAANSMLVGWKSKVWEKLLELARHAS
jgi:hypothetical protein